MDALGSQTPRFPSFSPLFRIPGQADWCVFGKKKRGRALPVDFHPPEAPERARYRVKTKPKRRAPKGRDLADLGICNENFSGFQMITSLLSRKSFAASGRKNGRAARLPDYVFDAVVRIDREIIANIRPLRGEFHCGDTVEIPHFIFEAARHAPKSSVERRRLSSHAEFRPIRCAYAPRCARSARLESVEIAPHGRDDL